MVRRCWPGWLLVMLAGVTGALSGQERGPPLVELHENYPNPFFPSTTIPFELSSTLCEGGRQPLVSLKIYNVLAQVVAVPVLVNTNGERLDGLRLRCGPHEGFWDGRMKDSQRELSPGVYYAHLVVDGRRYTLKMIARKD